MVNVNGFMLWNTLALYFNCNSASKKKQHVLLSYNHMAKSLGVEKFVLTNEALYAKWKGDQENTTSLYEEK